MKKNAITAVWFAVVALALSASVAFGGGKMYVVIDRGITDELKEGQAKNRNQVGEWMEEDLVRLLEKAGFDARLIKDRSEFKPGEGSYLLVVKITDYNPGSKAARMFVGYGAGAAGMKTHYDLYKDGTSPIQSDNLGVGSSRDWRNVVRKLDEQTVKGVKEKAK